MKRKTADAARGQWKGILKHFGFDEKALNPAKHGPCPFCGGKDRFRWANWDGKGGYACNQCGTGDGFQLLMRFKGWDFQTCAREVDAIVGNVESDPLPKFNAAERVERLNALWSSAKPIAPGDPVWRYLESRGCAVPPLGVRYLDRCPMPEGVSVPAMLTMVQDADGEPFTIHRTALVTPAGEKRQRAMMPISREKFPQVAAARLCDVQGNALGIAEGIETALAASLRFNVPVWSAINASLLARWEPPAGVEQVIIFGDCDPKYGGQLSAYQAAHRLALKGLRVSVRIPNQFGKDWADADAA